MENWFQDVGRPALFRALAEACDQIDNDLGASLKSYIEENARLSAELESWKGKASDADRWKEDAISLKTELQALKDLHHTENPIVSRTGTCDDARAFRSPLAPRSVNQVSNSRLSTNPGKSALSGMNVAELREECHKLEGNYMKLLRKYSELEDAHAKLNERLRDKTRAYNRWMDHANQLSELCQKRSRIIKKLEAKLEGAITTSEPFGRKFSPGTSASPASEPQVVAHEHVASKDPNEADSVRPDPVSRETPLIWPPITSGSTDHDSLRSTASPTSTESESGLHIDQNNDAPNPMSRISTEDGESYSLPPLPQDRNTQSTEVLVKNEPSSDTPFVVSERCLRKRKHDDQKENIGASAKVKIEDGSDPLITDERPHFMPHESIDFDTEGGIVVTPRKRNRTLLEPENAPVGGSVRIPRPHTDDDRLPAEWEDDITHGSEKRSHSRSRLRLDGSPKSAIVDVSRVALSLQAQETRSTLRALDHNIMLRQGLGVNRLTKEKELPSKRSGIANTMGDSDLDGTPKPSTKRAKTGRLQTLLNTPSPGHDNITSLFGTPLDRARGSRNLAFQAPERRELPFNKNSTKKTNKPFQSDGASEAPSKKQIPGSLGVARTLDNGIADNVTTDARRLRARPKSELSLSDFKINPNVNEGYDYAFTDVVRNRDERASLEGCVQEGCCGQTFRLQARAKRPLTSQAEFQVLLEKHLGDEAWKLSTMTKPEKEELWVEAKTRELANEHGKHRHRFHRAASPVGFWRADFPSTQEEQRDKEEAARAARRIVDERYREAMRPGGRWLFRDE